MTNPRQTPYNIDGKDSRMSRHKKAKTNCRSSSKFFPPIGPRSFPFRNPWLLDPLLTTTLKRGTNNFKKQSCPTAINHLSKKQQIKVYRYNYINWAKERDRPEKDPIKWTLSCFLGIWNKGQVFKLFVSIIHPYVELHAKFLPRNAHR